MGSGSEARVLPIHSVSPDQDRSVNGEHPKFRSVSGDGGEVSIQGKSEIHGSEGEDVQPSHSFSGSDTSVLGKSFTGLGESKVAVVEGMTISVVETGVGGGLTTHSHPSQNYELLSRVPKVVSHTEALDYGDVLQVDNGGVAYPGARSSGNVSSTDAGTIFGPVTDLHGERGKRSDLQGKSTAGYGYAKDVVGSGAGGGGSQYWAPKKGTSTSARDLPRESPVTPKEQLMLTQELKMTLTRRTPSNLSGQQSMVMPRRAQIQPLELT